MNKPEFGNYNNILWKKLFNNVECDQITKYYSDWTSNIDINNECIKFQKQIIHVETLIVDIDNIKDINGIVINKYGNIIISDATNKCIRIIEKKDLIYSMTSCIKMFDPHKLLIEF
jgi:hypothetical protein